MDATTPPGRGVASVGLLRTSARTTRGDGSCPRRAPPERFCPPPRAPDRRARQGRTSQRDRDGDAVLGGGTSGLAVDHEAYALVPRGHRMHDGGEPALGRLAENDTLGCLLHGGVLRRDRRAGQLAAHGRRGRRAAAAGS